MTSSGSLADLRVIAFPGAPNLPIFAAMEQGLFRQEGLALHLETTPSSVYQFEKLGSGEYNIACTAFDNVVAYDEGQGAAKLKGKPDFRVLMGATQIELAFVVAPDVKSYEDLRGRSIALDAVSTGFAFVVYEMLARHGLRPSDYVMAAVGATPQRWQSVKEGKHVGTVTIEPFTSIARAGGFNVLDVSSSIVDAYQGGTVAASEAWARANPGLVRGFIRAYLNGLEWTLDAANRAAAAELLMANMPAINRGVIDAVMDSLLAPQSGLTPNGAILREGMATVLELRSRYGEPKRNLTDIDKYLDLSFYEAVIRGIGD